MKEKFKLALTVQIIPALLIFKVAVKTCSIVDTGSGRRWSSRGRGTVARENGRCQHQRQCHSSSHHHHQLLPRLPLARHWPIDRYITKCGVKEGRSVGFSVLSFKHFLGSYDRRPFVITCPLYRAQHTHTHQVNNQERQNNNQFWTSGRRALCTFDKSWNQISSFIIRNWSSPVFFFLSVSATVPFDCSP